MKKSLIAAAVLSATLLTGCSEDKDFNPRDNMEPTIYGPPPIEDVLEDSEPEDNVEPEINGPSPIK